MSKINREQFEAWGMSDTDLRITLEFETYAGIAWLAWQAATNEAEAKLTALTSQLESVVAENSGLRHLLYKIGETGNANFGRTSLPTPATDAFLAEVRASGVDEFLRGSQLPYQIATVLADFDNVDDATLQTVIWSGQPPEPDGDVWHIEYVSRGNAIVRAVSKQLKETSQ